VWTWGDFSGYLQDYILSPPTDGGIMGRPHSPTVVRVLDDAIDLNDWCVVHRSGHVTCSGPDDGDMLGDIPVDPDPCSVGVDGGPMVGPSTFRYNFEIPGIDDAVSIAGNGPVNPGPRCVLRRSGRVACWGYDPVCSGALGNGHHGSVGAVADVVGVSGAVALVSGIGVRPNDEGIGAAFCALQGTGVVLCWGQNSFGMLAGDAP